MNHIERLNAINKIKEKKENKGSLKDVIVEHFKDVNISNENIDLLIIKINEIFELKRKNNMKINYNIIYGDNVIHCKTLEQARILLTWANNHSLCWSSGESYLNNIEDIYYKHGKDTCYRINEGVYQCIDYYKKEKISIIEFEDIFM